MIVVGATTAPYLLDSERELRWLRNAEEMAASADVRFFLALEHRSDSSTLHGEGQLAPMGLLDRLEDLQGDWWRFSIDDDESVLDSGNRLHRIVAGRNLIREYAIRAGASHILHLDADLIVPGDCIPKLLEMDWPICGGEVPSYCLRGPSVERYQAYPVQRHWNTAGFLLVAREVFTRIAWRHDPDRNMTDDPCYAHDALAMLGYPTFVRKDLIGEHESLVPLESRGLDRRLG